MDQRKTVANWKKSWKYTSGYQSLYYWSAFRRKCQTTVAGISAVTIGGFYLINNQNARKKTGKTMLKAMDSAENLIAKKMN